MGSKKTAKTENNLHKKSLSDKNNHKKVKETILAKKFYKAKVPKFTRKRKIEGKIHNKLYNLKFMSRIQCGIDQSSNFRILDMVFSQELFDQEVQDGLTRTKINVLCRPWFSLMNFKRISKIEFNKDDNIWEYFLEERWGTKMIQQSLYYITRVFNQIDRNKNLKNEELHNLRHKIEKQFIDRLNFNMNIDRIRNAAKKNFTSKLENLEIDLTEDLLSERIYLKQLDLKTLTIIHNSPFITFKKNIINKDKADDLVSFFLNKLFLDLLQIQNARVGGKDEGFEILSHIYSEDVMSYFSKVLDFTMNQNEDICRLTTQEMYIKIGEDKKMDGKFSMYKEFYYEAPNRFIIEVYYVLDSKA